MLPRRRVLAIASVFWLLAPGNAVAQVQMPEETVNGVKKRLPVPTKVVPANGHRAGSAAGTTVVGGSVVGASAGARDFA